METGANKVNNRGPDGETPLHLAVRAENAEAVKDLLTSGATSVNIQNEDGETPLHLAAKAKNENIVKDLLASGAEANVQNKNGETPLHLAAHAVDKNIVEALVKAGADAKIRTTDRQTTLLYLLKNSSEPGSDDFVYCQIASILIMYGGVDVTARGPGGVSPLDLAKRYRREWVLQEILRPMFDVVDAGVDERWILPVVVISDDHDEPSNAGRTPLHLYAAKMSRTDTRVARLLARDGSKYINVQDSENGETPLHLAAQHLNVELAKALLEFGANANARNVLGESALHKVITGAPVRSDTMFYSLVSQAANLKERIVASLLNHGASINVVDCDLRSPLHKAVNSRDSSLVLQLLQAGAEPNAPDKDGNTALHLECENRDTSNLWTLLDLGAGRLDVKNTKGLTPLDILVQLEDEEVAPMKKTRLGRYSTLYDLLMNRERMMAHVGNEELTRTLESEEFANAYPKFADVFRVLYKSAVRKRELLELVRNALIEISGLNVPEPCSNMIFRDFDEEALLLFGGGFTGIGTDEHQRQGSKSSTGGQETAVDEFQGAAAVGEVKEDDAEAQNYRRWNKKLARGLTRQQ